MGPKKDAKPAKAAPGEAPEGEDPTVLLSNYQKYSKLIGLQVNGAVTKALNDTENGPLKQLVIDDEFGPLGPGGTRALMTSLMGSGPGMKGGPYKLLSSLRIWKSNIGDDGAAAIAEVLRLGGAEVKIGFLELLDNNIGPKGCMGLGQSLSQGRNLSLLTLRLDYNHSLGYEGVANLSHGLRTNKTLKQLHLSFCQLTPDCGEPLGEILSNVKSGLEVLGLNGNRLAGKGLYGICRGLSSNGKLITLQVADNLIDSTDDDVEALELFRDCLMSPAVVLSKVDLMYNRIGQRGAEALLPAFTSPDTSKKIEEFLVSVFDCVILFCYFVTYPFSTHPTSLLRPPFPPCCHLYPHIPTTNHRPPPTLH